MTTALPPRVDDFGSHAVLLSWPDFLAWSAGKKTHATVAGRRIPLPPGWAPGQHVAMIGTTGEGKSTFAVGLLGTRKYVIALDPKGEDETLEQAGYARVREMPPPKGRPVGRPQPGTERWIWDRVQRGLPVGLVVGYEPKTDSEDAHMAGLMRDTIAWTRRSRGWALYVDEFELLSSQRMMNQGPAIERMLITARRAGTSVLTSFQAPAWVSKHATRQASFTIMWPTAARDTIKTVAESAGRDWRVIAAAVDELPPFHALVIPKLIRSPMLITSAPKVGG